MDFIANEVRHLALLAGWKEEGLEIAEKLAFVTGFPDRIPVEIQQVRDVE